jgi:hypothetical protein
MANLIITYWRDIPSAVSVKLGRKEEKRMLDNRFMEAIDMAAMPAGPPIPIHLATGAGPIIGGRRSRFRGGKGKI